MTSVNCNSYISPPNVLFLGKDWRIQQRISAGTWHTAHQIIPFILIIKAHQWRRYTSREHIGDATSGLHVEMFPSVLLKKLSSYCLKSKLVRNIKQQGEMQFKVQFWCNIRKRAVQQSQINSAAHVKWFNVTPWCDTHIWTWKLWKGNILHPSPDHREGVTFPYSKAIFHFDSLLSFNLAKQFPLTWWDWADGGAESGEQPGERLWRRSSDWSTCGENPEMADPEGLMWAERCGCRCSPCSLSKHLTFVWKAKRPAIPCHV